MYSRQLGSGLPVTKTNVIIPINVKFKTNVNIMIVSVTGNQNDGRVGRLCMNFILMKAGYPPAIIRKEERLDYYLALEQADKGNKEPLFELIISEVERSLFVMEESIERHLENGS